ncbi:MAG TPA: lamin tail domain-containing protein [Gemmatimonadaceae bacterium]|nr:lamin tail domain-containing protein [Gemmatimonadaceae bacterium]
MENLSRYRGIAAGALAGVCVVVAACVDTNAPLPSAQVSSKKSLTELVCKASIATRSVSCEPASRVAAPVGSNAEILTGQNTYVRLTSSNVFYDSGTQIFQFDVTVQNLSNEAIGTPDGVVADPQGIQVFFAGGPTVTGGSGTISVANADGVGSFTGASQPYFAYHQILPTNAVSDSKTWQLSIPPTATTFTFGLLIETDIQYLLVINEVMVNPSGNTIESTGDWVEVYNAGSHSVNLQGLVLADSAASGRRPYHLINDTDANLTIPSGGYFVLGSTKNTVSNGGVPVDYAWGGAVALASSLDAFKIARVFGTDTLTIDRTQYANASISAADGVSRELKNPALDNSNMDGSNWGSASVTSVYGTGGRGTPKAQNSSFTPNLMVEFPILGSRLTDPGRQARGSATPSRE